MSSRRCAPSLLNSPLEEPSSLDGNESLLRIWVRYLVEEIGAFNWPSPVRPTVFTVSAPLDRPLKRSHHRSVGRICIRSTHNTNAYTFIGQVMVRFTYSLLFFYPYSFLIQSACLLVCQTKLFLLFINCCLCESGIRHHVMGTQWYKNKLFWHTYHVVCDRKRSLSLDSAILAAQDNNRQL